MSRVHLGYGSEWHMLRYLGRHRRLLTERVLELTGGSSIKWCDFDFTKGISPEQNYGDAELKGLNFLQSNHPARAAWSKWWPQTGNVQNWDAVGIHRTEGGVEEWLLVEAKGNVSELESVTKAKERGGLPAIRRCLSETRKAFGVVLERDWTKPYYQYANRLAVLHFLEDSGVPARLLFVYFTGDCARSRICPAGDAEWEPGLAVMKSNLGLTGTSLLDQKIHHLFLPVVLEEGRH